MPEISTGGHRRAGRWGRAVGAGLLVVVLFLLGTYDDAVFRLLTAGWQELLNTLGLVQWSSRLQSQLPQGVAKRYLPVVATYAVAYVSLCLLLLRVLLPAPGQWRWVWRGYLAVLGAYLLLTLLGRLAGNVPWVYQLSRHLIDFLASPLPVLLTLTLFWSGLGGRATTAEKR